MSLGEGHPGTNNHGKHLTLLNLLGQKGETVSVEAARVSGLGEKFQEL